MHGDAETDVRRRARVAREPGPQSRLHLRPGRVENCEVNRTFDLEDVESGQLLSFHNL